MELEQILKQLDWLDEERRKAQARLSTLEERLAAIEGNITPLPAQIREVGSEVTRLGSSLERMDGFDDSIRQVRIEAKQLADKIEKDLKRRDDETEKIRRSELRSVDERIAEIRKEIEQLPDLKRGLQARSDEEARLGKLIDELRVRLETIRRSDEEYNRTIRLFDDGRRQDAKRLTDIQGELSAVRKRVDESRGRIELNSASIKKIEARLNEIALLENEQRETMLSFIENQSLKEVERDRVWKDWQSRFQFFEAQTTEIGAALQNLETTSRSVKRSQQAIEELTLKVERRINEITEIQRLSEERFRQEWVTFKADDQKRWTNYTLTLEEQRSESQRQHERLVEKVTELEDAYQEVEDIIQLINEQTEKRLQTLLTMSHEWMTSYERTLGRS
jgi:septal ring factor EnvC (AmiA/AmiB activator)